MTQTTPPRRGPKPGSPYRMNRLQVPAEPIQRELRTYLRIDLPPGVRFEDLTPRDRTDFAPMSNLAELIWPGTSRKVSVGRLRWLLRQQFVTFDLAERILGLLDREFLWYSDPVLAEHYQRVDLSPRKEAA